MNNLQAMRIVWTGLIELDPEDWEASLTRDIARTAFPRLLRVAEMIQANVEGSGKCYLCGLGKPTHHLECPMYEVLMDWRGEGKEGE